MDDDPQLQLRVHVYTTVEIKIPSTAQCEGASVGPGAAALTASILGSSVHIYSPSNVEDIVRNLQPPA